MGGAPCQHTHAQATQAWRVALYACTASQTTVLSMLASYVAERARAAEFASMGMPALRIHPCAEHLFPDGLPEPWAFDADGETLPHIFDAAPIRGKHHVILQVELSAESHTYTVIVFGGIWPFRAAFDKADIKGGHVEAQDGSRDYVRCLPDMQDDEASRTRLASVLGGEVLCGHAVFLLNETGNAADPLCTWLASCASVYQR